MAEVMSDQAPNGLWLQRGLARSPRQGHKNESGDPARSRSCFESARRWRCPNGGSF